MNTIVIAYVPVLHTGYKKFFQKNSNATLFILDNSLIAEFTHLSKEIRALEPKEVLQAVYAWDIFKEIELLDTKRAQSLADFVGTIVIPREDIMLKVWEKFFPKAEVLLDDIFLRWDKHNTVLQNNLNPDVKISRDDFDQKIIALAKQEGEKSSDWWRRVGCVLVKGDKIIFSAHNQHMPSEHICYTNGDPRNNFHKGVRLELGTSIHAEAAVIAWAARKGVQIENASIYVSTFPCPPCAKLIAYSGIKKVYYSSGYGVLDGESILKQNGVEIVFVES